MGGVGTIKGSGVDRVDWGVKNGLDSVVVPNGLELNDVDGMGVAPRRLCLEFDGFGDMPIPVELNFGDEGSDCVC